MPGPSALRIADLPAARDQSWSPVVTAVLTYPRRTWPDFHAAFVNDSPVLATLADDGDRRGDRAPVLVAHSTPAFSGDPAELAEAAGRLLDIEDKPEITTYAWPYAQPEPLQRPFDRDGQVYLCGDAYGKKPRVQTAWLSGRAVARQILRERQSTDR
jgi:predicted NAD/FAD-dependent oxidoreductase